MSNIVIKTEYMVKEIAYSHINFAMIVSLALGKIEQKESLDLSEDIRVVLPLLECADILGYKNNNPKTSKDSINALIKKGMKKTVITISEEREGINKQMLITGYKTSLKRNEIIIFFNKDLLKHMYIKYIDENNVINNRYICYDINMIKNCNNLHTYYLYELFKLYSYKKNTYDLSFDELKKYLHIEHINIKGNMGLNKIKNESYMNYKVFKRVILSPAIKYINENTDLDVKIVKEDKYSHKYILNGIEKEVVSLKKIFFKIIPKKIPSYSIGIIAKLALENGKSIEEIDFKIEGLVKALKKHRINISKKQLTTLMSKYKDETLIKCVLIECRDKKDIKDLGKYAYWKIGNILENNEDENYKKAFYLKYMKKKDINNFELTEEMKSDEALVKVYDAYRINKNSVCKDDVIIMIDCLAKYNEKKIISAINICFGEARKTGKIISSFKYIEKMLKSGRFNGRGKKDNQPRKSSSDGFDEFLKMHNIKP